MFLLLKIHFFTGIAILALGIRGFAIILRPFPLAALRRMSGWDIAPTGNKDEVRSKSLAQKTRNVKQPKMEATSDALDKNAAHGKPCPLSELNLGG